MRIEMIAWAAAACAALPWCAGCAALDEGDAAVSIDRPAKAAAEREIVAASPSAPARSARQAASGGGPTGYTPAPHVPARTDADADLAYASTPLIPQEEIQTSIGGLITSHVLHLDPAALAPDAMSDFSAAAATYLPSTNIVDCELVTEGGVTMREVTVVDSRGMRIEVMVKPAGDPEQFEEQLPDPLDPNSDYVKILAAVDKTLFALSKTPNPARSFIEKIWRRAPASTVSNTIVVGDVWSPANLGFLLAEYHVKRWDRAGLQYKLIVQPVVMPAGAPSAFRVVKAYIEEAAGGVEHENEITVPH